MGAPTLNSVNVSGNSVTWNWSLGSTPPNNSDPSCTPSSNALQRVERRLAGSTGAWTNVATKTSTATTHTETNCPDGEWDFRVVAIQYDYFFTGFSCIPSTTDRPSNAITKVVGEDTTPNPFDLGSNYTNAAISTYYYSNTITVAGINAASPVSTNGGVQYQKNGGGWTSTSGTVVNGDTVRVRMQSSGSFNTTVTATLTIGGVSDSFSVTTQNPGGQIVLPSSGSISYNDIRAAWGPAPSVAVNMYDWRKNGPYWQDYPENAGVPTGNPISLSDFYGCKGVWTVDPLPSSVGSYSTGSVGYTPQNPSQPLEYKWTAATISQVHSVSGPAYNTWSETGSVSVTYTASSSSGETTLNCYARPLGGYGGASNEVFLGSVNFKAGDGGPLV
jgi:hypothetical protein